MAFFKSPGFGIFAAALGAALTAGAAAYPGAAAWIALASFVLHGLTAQAAKNSPSPQVKP